jgi:hypothetical protein
MRSSYQDGGGIVEMCMVDCASYPTAVMEERAQPALTNPPLKTLAAIGWQE